MLTCVSAIGGFLFGYDTGVIGGANQYIEDDMDLNALLEETVVSIAVLGAVFGSITSAPCSDFLGRKKTIMLADLTFFFGAVFMGIAPNVSTLILGRFVVGFGVGMAAMIVPLYLAEAAPPDLRGRIVATNIAFVTSGQLISYLVCLALGSNWRWMLGLATVPAFLQFVGMFLLPESPRWLVKEGRELEAKQTL